MDGKQEVRERIWAALERENAVRPPGAHGRIPNFVGAERAADLLAALPAWRSARVLKSNPDKPQLPVRMRALDEGKLVYMAVPKLADEHPFYLLDPAALSAPAAQVATSKIAATSVPRVGLDQMQPIDLIVCGTVAVNREGARLGKGAGYSDIEFALAQEAGLIGPETTVITTVHSLQVVDGPLPETEHDFRVDVIVTPEEVIECGPARRPDGLIWDHLDEGRIAAIPILARRGGR